MLSFAESAISAAFIDGSWFVLGIESIKDALSPFFRCGVKVDRVDLFGSFRDLPQQFHIVIIIDAR